MSNWLLDLFRAYRHEGQEFHCPLPDDESADYAGTEPEPDYEHPFVIPGDRYGVIEVYGDCGQTKLDKKWERKNMGLAKGLPGRWNNGKGRMYCHNKMAPALREALRRCEVYGVLDYIDRMGCFKWRHIQHNPKKPLSYHSWGIAVDINPKHNRLKRYKRGSAPDPHTDEWWEVWPKGVPENLVYAFKEAGFTWGGDWQTVPDPMHFQLGG